MKKKVKIVFSGNFPFGGAAANYIRNIAHCLGEFFDIEVLLTKGYFFGDVSNEFDQQGDKLDSIKFKHLNYRIQPINPLARIYGNIIGVIKVLHFLKKEGGRNNVDMIIVYDISFIINLPLLIICHIYRIKLINILVEYYPKSKRFDFNWLHNILFYMGIKYLIRYNDGVIVLSNFLAKFVRERGFKGDLLILPNIVDSDFFLRNVPPFKEDFLTIGYAGSPTVKDGIEDLLNSFALVHKALPNTHLLIVGDTPRHSVVNNLRNITIELKINQFVTFSGLKSLSEVANLLNSCDVLVLARPAGIQSEAGFPTKLGEYFACKKAVVVTRVGDIGRYFAGTDVVQLVEPNNVESIAWGIKALLNNNQRRLLLAENGFVWMIQNLSIVNAKEQLNPFLSKLLEGEIE